MILSRRKFCMARHWLSKLFLAVSFKSTLPKVEPPLTLTFIWKKRLTGRAKGFPKLSGKPTTCATGYTGYKGWGKMVKIKKYKVFIFNSLTKEATWEIIYDSTLGNAIEFAKRYNATKTLRSMCNSSFFYERHSWLFICYWSKGRLASKY